MNHTEKLLSDLRKWAVEELKPEIKGLALYYGVAIGDDGAFSIVNGVSDCNSPLLQGMADQEERASVSDFIIDLFGSLDNAGNLNKKNALRLVKEIEDEMKEMREHWESQAD